MTGDQTDFSAFDSKKLKVLSWWSRHIAFVVVVCLLVSGLAAYLRLLTGLFYSISIGVVSTLWLFSSSWLPGNAFAFKNHLDKFFLKHDTDYTFMRDQYQSVKRSAFLKQEEFVWDITVNGTEVAMMFTWEGGCIMWLQLDRPFPHIVVDALADNHWFACQVVKKNLPAQKIQLEGDFPDYFHVYIDPGQQVMSLQILAPDRMQFMVDNLRHFNLEIQDNYLRLFAAHAQHSSQDFRAMLDAMASLSQGMKLASLNEIRD